MFKNLNLHIETGGKPWDIPIHLDKMTDVRTGLKTGYRQRRDGPIRLVRQIQVLTRGDVEIPTKPEDIECVVERSKTESVFCCQEGGDEARFITVDRDTIKQHFPNTRDVRVICALPLAEIKPWMFDGTHYHVSLHGTVKKKVKVVEASDKRMFNIVFHGLVDSGSCFITEFTSFNRKKFSAIYADPHRGLVMSNLIHSNYFRPAHVAHILVKGEESFTALMEGGVSKKRLAELREDGKEVHRLVFQKVLDHNRRAALEPDITRDRYEEVLQAALDRAKASREEKAAPAAEDLEEIIDDDGDLDDLI